MPRQIKRYLVLRDFDFSPRPNVIRVFKAGQIRSGLTRACIKRGLALNALQLETQEDLHNGETNHL